MRLPEDDAAPLFDMLKYARITLRLIEGRSEQSFADDVIFRLAIERAIEIIGEAARGVSREFQDAHPEIPWPRIIAQRHVLAHEYGEIVYEKFWRVASVHIPALIAQLEPLVPPIPPDPEPETTSPQA